MGMGNGRKNIEMEIRKVNQQNFLNLSDNVLCSNLSDCLNKQFDIVFCVSFSAIKSSDLLNTNTMKK